jgi:hypothetical protein
LKEKMMISKDKKEEISRVVGEAIGEGSMCWVPIPEGVFDSTQAIGVVDRLVEKIVAIVERNEG